MRGYRLGMVLTVAALLQGGTALAQDRTVRIYNWSDYIDPQILEDFTKETGIKTVYDVYDSNEILETKLLAGNSGYDVVVPTGTFLGRQIQAGIFKELDRSKLPNWSNLDPELMAEAAKFDPGNAHAVIWMWGTSGIAYNEEKVKAALGDTPVESWGVLFDPANAQKLSSCGIYMLDSPTDVLPSELIYLGLDPDAKDQETLEKAAEELMKVRPYVRKFHSSETINALASGDICAALMYSGDAGIAATRAEEANNGVTISYKIPEEGAQLWFDMMAIPADAPDPDAAHAFINYILRPEVIAKASNFVTYPNANAKATELVDPALREDTDLFPTEEMKKKLVVITPYDQRAQRNLTRLWTRVTTGN